MKKNRNVHIGCSGWNYKHWRGLFYPEEYRHRDWFRFYASVFDTVEINNSFYRLPEAATFRAWRVQAPNGFLYAVKANRYLTHMKKLKDAKQPLQKFLTRAKLLAEHLGAILYQLPPNWRLNIERFDSFLKLLPPDLHHVFEFRDQSWMVDKVFRLLDDRGVSFCVHDMPGLLVPRIAVGPITYVRFHGADKKYQGGYPRSALRGWWRWIEKQVQSGRPVYVYFNNDAEAHAVRDAQVLKKIAGLA